MANNIERASKFVPIIDDIYKAASATEILDTQAIVDFTGTKEVKVLKVSTTGLGDYSRSDGYPKGDTNASWETLALTEERGKEISVDRMDDEETLGLTFGAVTGNFMREQVVPEIDAYRFAKYASHEGILSNTETAALTAENIIAKINAAKKEMDANEVPTEGRILFVNSDLQILLSDALNRTWGSDNKVSTILTEYNGMKIKYVAPSRFYTGITLNSGESSWGFAKAPNAKAINFMIVYPSAVLQVKKFALPKIFTPDENQNKDAWKYQFRLYHDAFVYDNKAKGVYVNIAYESNNENDNA